MSMNNTPRSERVHIGLFGRRNAGKSSLINALTGQDLAVVSPVKGTTTDPVYKSMELLPLGPVVMIDTPGLDDSGELGELRTEKARQVLGKTDIALLVADGSAGLSGEDRELLELIRGHGIPCLTVYNKADALPGERPDLGPDSLWVSAQTGENIHALKERIAALRPAEPTRPLVSDLLSPSDLVVLVVPIDKAAPKGRLILPQQQVIRDVLEADCTALVVKENGLAEALASLGRKPRLVITDSQVFAQADAATPLEIPLTSFSILFARYKGALEQSVRGVSVVDRLEDGDRILVAEGCTHHRQCDDIGTVKIPRWMGEYTGKDLQYQFTSGGGFPQDLTPYRMVVHCGGCMLNGREMARRVRLAEEQGIPVTNYGILIACLQGILRRSLEPFPSIAALLG